MIRVGIIGGAGYTAGELIRLLLIHPETEIVFINSNSNAGNRVADIHTGLHGDTELVFTDKMPFDEIDLLFMCTAHGESRRFFESHVFPDELKIIDLSMDYRIKSQYHDFIYGLPELNRRNTCKSRYVSNPGGFATCIELGLLPLAKEHLLKGDVQVNALIGSTGTGSKPHPSLNFSWRDNNISVFKPFEHPHLPEIMQSIKQLQPEYDGEIDFIPYYGNFPRGIFATLVVKCDIDIETLYKMYVSYYDRDSFTHIVNTPLDLKQVINTNKCLIHLEKHGNKLLITSIIDNMLKGACGQAVHNMNLLFGLAETVGLQLKPSAF